MMSARLRIEMLLCALIFLGLVLNAVKKRRLQLRYSMLWLLAGLCMLAAAAFPGSIELLTGLLGIQLPVNMVFFFGIIFLLILSFALSTIVSRQSEQIKQLAQHLAIEKYLRRRNTHTGD